MLQFRGWAKHGDGDDAHKPEDSLWHLRRSEPKPKDSQLWLHVLATLKRILVPRPYFSLDVLETAGKASEEDILLGCGIIAVASGCKTPATVAQL